MCRWFVKSRNPGLLVVLLTATTVLVCACGRVSVRYVDDGASLGIAEARSLLESVSGKKLSSKPYSEAPQLRHEALAQLRGQGQDPSNAADTITNAFPARTNSVPVYVERATFDGTPALVIVEAWGKPGGRLSSKRLWVIGAGDDRVLFAASTGSGD